jgi:ADP-ribosyl-[dinitrogen reductase] hydrolase
MRPSASTLVVDTVQTVLHGYFRTDSFERCLIDVVNRGEDADTTGALAGMLAGATFGAAAIPRRWLGRLETPVKTAIEAQVRGLLTIARQRLQENPTR